MREEFERLIEWFDREKRALPWRRCRTPYMVLVSEIMLQQTRVQAVIPYFERWMERYPTIEALARAPIDEVILQWEGLGYYSRARNLHKGAQQIVAEFGGQIPKSRSQLLSICGIGPYTAGAIRAFAFGERAAAVDGNVKRVASRYWALEQIGQLEERIEEALPEKRPEAATEALIELGATLCKPKSASCSACPLRQGCRAKAIGRPLDFPPPKKRPKLTHLTRFVALIESEDALLVRKTPPGEVMADLYHLPYSEEGIDHCLAHLGVKPKRVGQLQTVKHSFTRYIATLYPTHYEIEARPSCSGFSWVDRAALREIPFCSGHREIVQCAF